MNELQQILLSEAPLWISPSGYRQLMVAAFSLPSAEPPAAIASLLFDEKTYKTKCKEALQGIKAKQEADSLTNEALEILDLFPDSEFLKTLTAELLDRRK